MGKAITSFAQLEAECQKKMARAMDKAESKTYLDALENLSDFYSGGTPTYYKRTGALGNTPKTTGVTGGGNHLHAEVYLDSLYEYNTGTYTAAKVMTEAEIGGSGIVGKSGFWKKTEEEALRNVESSFGKEFGK